MLLNELRSEHFASRLHEGFCVRLSESESVEIELIQVTEWGPAAANGQRRPFTLVFQGPKSDRYLPQRTYPIDNPSLGLLEVFIVPIGPRDGRMCYEAIFS